MKNELVKLCSLNGVSGRESDVRNYILKRLDGVCECSVDALGNITAFVKGKHRAAKKIMVDAHMDEVGLIITAVTVDGMLKFDTVGGIDVSVLLARRVVINGSLLGVISSKPVHMLSGDEKSKMPKIDSLYIDIGVASEKEALKLVNLGDVAVFESVADQIGDLYLDKAIDDRAGCAALLDLITAGAEYDFYASFSVLEEVGAGARTAAFGIDPDVALVLESTTASDIKGVAEDKTVCNVGQGAVLSFMDRGTLYDKKFFDFAKSVADKNAIKYQVKRAVTGGNNAAGIHATRNGIKTLAISVPCRYIHSQTSVADMNDVLSVRDLAKALITALAEGESID
jgi:endoglucanase